MGTAVAISGRVQSLLVWPWPKVLVTSRGRVPRWGEIIGKNNKMTALSLNGRISDILMLPLKFLSWRLPEQMEPVDATVRGAP
jgi:hypothetical protein